MSIEVKSLTKLYGEQKAVNNVSFSVGRGEIVGFLGPNGAGKSTTMKMITGYLQPTGGSVQVGGVDVLTQPLETKKKIGYLPESNALYYDMYVREYLRFAAGVRKLSSAKKRVEDAIQRVGLTPESGKRIGQLSKGYKQRVGLAAAILHEPEVLILDEPTSGLDPNQIVDIRNVIRELGKDKLVLFSSHILQEVEALCDRVIIINKGQLVADDRIANLQQGGKNVVTVAFAETLEPEWLQRIPSVKRVIKGEANAWTLETDEPDMVRKALLELSVAQGLNIQSLQTGNKSLEEVFRRLTGVGD